MAYETMLFETADGVATLTLNRPARRNAFDDTLAAELQDALRQCERDDAVRALVLTGAQGAFSAGQDLDAVRRREGEFSFRAHVLATYNPIVLKLRSIEKPVLAAVDGSAAGAGFGIALACDLRYASESARFRLAFGALGLVPDSGTSFFLPRMLGLGRALELAYTNEFLSAQEALALGLLNKLFPAAEVLPATLALAHKLAQGPTRGFALTKRAMNFGLSATLEQALDYEAHLQDVAGRTADYREGVAAFLEKRAPQFQGK